MREGARRLRGLRLADGILGVSLVVALVAMFLPWYTVTCPSICSPSSFDAFHSWGFAYCSVWLLTAAYFAVRVFGSPVMRLSAIRKRGWPIPLAGGVLMLICGVLFYNADPSGSALGFSYGVNVGWFVALAGAVGVGVAAYLLRTDGSKRQANLGSNSEAERAAS
ncbi:MAG TPA: hypothetical protein VFB34_01190 [Chloroflexota bacterium]|nr:hypothetical protein [Chloroflexota bacterium]